MSTNVRMKSVEVVVEVVERFRLGYDTASLLGRVRKRKVGPMRTCLQELSFMFALFALFG